MPIGVYQHKPLPLQQRLKISQALKGRVFSEAHRNNLRISSTGFRHSEESKRKMSALLIGKPGRRKGCKCSAESRARMSAAQKGKKLSPETKERIRLANIRTNAVARLAKGPRWNKGKKGVQTWSEESRKKVSESLKRIGHKPPLINGENHYKWKGGITPKNLVIRNSLAYKVWRNAVFSRDNWTCQKYKTRGCVLRAHHILSFHKHPELRMAVDNGVTLSQKAHDEFHNKYGRKNNTAAQLIEFLSAPIAFVPASDPIYIEKKPTKK